MNAFNNGVGCLYPDWAYFLHEYQKIRQDFVNLSEQFDSFTALNELVLANPIAWNAATSYKKNTIVLYNGEGYVSKDDVQPNIRPGTSDKWLKISEWNPQIAALTAEVTKFNQFYPVINKFAGKRILIVGDSISDPNIGWNERIKETWAKHFKTKVEAIGATVTNIASSSSGYTVRGNTNKTFVEMLQGVDMSNYDMLILEGGINDRNSLLGDPYSTQSGTIWGALRDCQAVIPDTMPVFVIPPMNNGGNYTRIGRDFAIGMLRNVIVTWARSRGYSLIDFTLAPGFGVNSNHIEGLHPLNAYTPTLADFAITSIIAGGTDYNNQLDIYTMEITGEHFTNGTLEMWMEGNLVHFSIRATFDNTQTSATIDLPLPARYETRGVALCGNDPCRYIIGTNSKLYLYSYGTGVKLNGNFNVDLSVWVRVVEEAAIFTHPV